MPPGQFLGQGGRLAPAARCGSRESFVSAQRRIFFVIKSLGSGSCGNSSLCALGTPPPCQPAGSSDAEGLSLGLAKDEHPLCIFARSSCPIMYRTKGGSFVQLSCAAFMKARCPGIRWVEPIQRLRKNKLVCRLRQLYWQSIYGVHAMAHGQADSILRHLRQVMGAEG